MDQTPARIAGKRVQRDDGIEVRSPYDRRLLGSVPACTPADLDSAVVAAHAAHRAGPPPAHERAAVLDRAAALLEERRETFALAVCDEAAKPITLARAEVDRACGTFRHAAAAARSTRGEVLPLDVDPNGVGWTGMALRVPRGVVLAVTPFNFPLNLAVHKVAPAIAAGCPFVLKPSPRTPLTALLLGDLLADAGLPPGSWSVVTCADNLVAGLVSDERIAVISFTGSPRVGWTIPSLAPRARALLELGDVTPAVVQPDVDVEAVAASIARASYAYGGQACIAVQRVTVHRDVHDRFVEALAEVAQATVGGDPRDEATQVSSLITPASTERVQRLVADAVHAGASVVEGDRLTHDGVLRPTVLTDVETSMDVCAQEAFGPVIGVRAHASLDDGLAFACEPAGGLQIGIFTADVGAALAAAPTLPFGGVLLNQVPTWRGDAMPYGGTGTAGNTREGPAWAVEEMTERRLVVLPTGDR